MFARLKLSPSFVAGPVANLNVVTAACSILEMSLVTTTALLKDSVFSVAFPRTKEPWSHRSQTFLIGTATLLMRRNWRPHPAVRNQLGQRWKVSRRGEEGPRVCECSDVPASTISLAFSSSVQKHRRAGRPMIVTWGPVRVQIFFVLHWRRHRRT